MSAADSQWQDQSDDSRELPDRSLAADNQALVVVKNSDRGQHQPEGQVVAEGAAKTAVVRHPMKDATGPRPEADLVAAGRTPDAASRRLAVPSAVASGAEELQLVLQWAPAGQHLLRLRQM